MGKKSKNKTKCERRRTVSANTSAPELALVSAPCRHGAPADWSTIPYMPTFLEDLAFESFHGLLSKVAAEMQTNYLRLEARQRFIGGLAAVGTAFLLRQNDCQDTTKNGLHLLFILLGSCLLWRLCL